MSHAFQLFDALPQHIEDALRASIERFGVLVPVVKDQHGNTIDGHHRARIAEQVGVKYRVDMVQCADEDEAREIARHLNARRRHLSADQLKEHIIMLAQRATPAGVGQLSQNEIAQVAGVSQPYVNRVLGDPDVITGYNLPDSRRGADGKVYPASRPTVVTAKNEREAERAQQALAVLGDDRPAVPIMDVKRLERVTRETVAERRRAQPIEPTTVDGPCDIRHGDFREVLADLSDVDAIITDPPYPREFIPLFGDLSALASKVLKPSGVLVVMAGQSWLCEYLTELSRHLAYRWIAAYIARGPQTRMHAARIGTGWKPLLIFQRHDAAGVPFLMRDVFNAADGDDKQFHHWGQSEAGIAEQVERFTQPGALVVDPFLGGGTTAVVCRDLGRRFVGCDVDAAAVATSRERL